MVNEIKQDDLLAIAADLVPDKKAVRKWGNNLTVGTTEEDIWSAGAVYAFPADTGVAVEIVSDDEADDQEITIEGLDIGFNLQTETLTLNGLTAVDSALTWTRINRAYNNDSTDFDGTVLVRANGAGATYASLETSHQQTSQAIYTVPDKHIGLILHADASINRTGAATLSADFFLSVREFGKVFRKKWHAGVQKDGKSQVTDVMILPERVPERSDIKMSGVVSTTPVSGSAWFYVLLMKVG